MKSTVTLWVAAAAALLLSGLYVVHTERQFEAYRADQAESRVAELEADLGFARERATNADNQLADFAAQSALSFQQQAEAAARMAGEMAALNRRLTATQKEIERADPGLRLDDPLPNSLRDSIACTRGDLSACDTSQTGAIDLPPRSTEPDDSAGASASNDHSA